MNVDDAPLPMVAVGLFLGTALYLATLLWLGRRRDEQKTKKDDPS